MSSPVLLHSSRPKTVCVQNAICLLKSLCSTFTKILCYIDKTAGYGYRRINRYQNLRSRLSDMNQQSNLHSQRFCRFESGIFAIIRVMQETGICGICDHDRKTDQGRSTTTVSAGVDDSHRKRRTCQPDEVEEATSLTAFFYDTYQAANSVCSSSPGSFQNL